MRAELRAAKIGLAYAWSLGFKKIFLQMDSLAAVNSIQGPSIDDMRHSNTIDGINNLRQRDW
ncbi:hypothetical protein LINPERPRIM_LOCUS21790 [Linum perenne]